MKILDYDSIMECKKVMLDLIKTHDMTLEKKKKYINPTKTKVLG